MGHIKLILGLLQETNILLSIRNRLHTINYQNRYDNCVTQLSNIHLINILLQYDLITNLNTDSTLYKAGQNGNLELIRFIMSKFTMAYQHIFGIGINALTLDQDVYIRKGKSWRTYRYN